MFSLSHLAQKCPESIPLRSVRRHLNLEKRRKFYKLAALFYVSLLLSNACLQSAMVEKVGE